MFVVITGAGGFIGKNLVCQLEALDGVEIFQCSRDATEKSLADNIAKADYIIHLAGVNRPDDDKEFDEVNAGFTRKVCELARQTGKTIPIFFSSSTQAGNGTAYGTSKLEAEAILRDYAHATDSAVRIYRLPGVMGKWCRPNYNSVVATFCYNISHGLPVRVDDEEKVITLNYIDDLAEDISSVISGISRLPNGCHFSEIEPLYEISLKSLVKTLEGFRDGRRNLHIDSVGTGLKRALYATYISYLEEEDFSYPLKSHTDSRGRFVEFLKTVDSGQFSFLSAKPGVTRGKHYHHTKTEKFLVVQGEACFRFRQLLTNKYHEVTVSADNPVVVESIPGWAHDITNTGSSELIVLLWSSEVFDKDSPDTTPKEIQ